MEEQKLAKWAELFGSAVNILLLPMILVTSTMHLLTHPTGLILGLAVIVGLIGIFSGFGDSYRRKFGCVGLLSSVIILLSGYILLYPPMVFWATVAVTVFYGFLPHTRHEAPVEKSSVSRP